MGMIIQILRRMLNRMLSNLRKQLLLCCGENNLPLNILDLILNGWFLLLLCWRFCQCRLEELIIGCASNLLDGLLRPELRNIRGLDSKS